MDIVLMVNNGLDNVVDISRPPLQFGPMSGLAADQPTNVIHPAYRQGIGDNELSQAILEKTSRADHVNKSQVEVTEMPPRWDRTVVLPVEKNIYRQHVTTALRSEAEVAAYRLAREIAVSGRCVPKPRRGVEAQCWPVALSGRDLLAVVQAVPSEVKAVAYLLPAMLHVLSQPPLQSGDGPIALVLVTTRERAREVHRVACDLQEYTKVGAACLPCREPKEAQLEDIEKCPQICIAAPLAVSSPS
ncbi:putative ATP-dependent RNA helicase DDX5 [Dermacentor variabilis]|uniref:putative ATP-dependent RNA helicase DDX5 n=1 Tax=Dermacentor variabilis TaxID=34621 RepID=UPI003F5C51B7